MGEKLLIASASLGDLAGLVEISKLLRVAHAPKMEVLNRLLCEGGGQCRLGKSTSPRNWQLPYINQSLDASVSEKPCEVFN
jgi:hypothetical protein